MIRRLFTRPSEPGPETDLQNRVNVISKSAEEIRERAKKEGNKDMENLAYCVVYLSKIVNKHLRTNER